MHLKVYSGVDMGRTNIQIDDPLIARVMERYGVRTKREAVDLALSRAAGEAMSREEALAMGGRAGKETWKRCDRIGCKALGQETALHDEGSPDGPDRYVRMDGISTRHGFSVCHRVDSMAHRR